MFGIGGLDLVDLVYIVAFVCLLVLLLVQIFIGPLSDTIERKKKNLGNKFGFRQNPSGTAARPVDYSTNLILREVYLFLGVWVLTFARLPEEVIICKRRFGREQRSRGHRPTLRQRPQSERERVHVGAATLCTRIWGSFKMCTHVRLRSLYCARTF